MKKKKGKICSWQTAKHIYSTSSLSDTTRRSLRMSNPQTFQGKIRAREYALYQMRAGSIVLSRWLFLQTIRGERWKSLRRGLMSASSFLLPEFIFAYTRRSSIALTSIIIFHSVRLENSQIYERTSGQINTPCECEGGFGIRGIRE